MERLVVFLLSQVVERPGAHEETSFALHPRTENCKVLWNDGRAVGFYTVKHKGRLCDNWSSRCYLLPVLDTVLVRRSCRRRGFGLQILHDFCSSFSSEDFLGVSSPLSSSMVAFFSQKMYDLSPSRVHFSRKPLSFSAYLTGTPAVIGTFLEQHEEYRDRLYEVEAPGGWTQRRNIWLNIQLGCYLSKQTDGCVLTPVGTCNSNAPLVTASTQLRDVKQEGSSQSRGISAAGCCSSAHTDVLDFKAPSWPQIAEESFRWKDAPSSKPKKESPEKMQKSPKRAMREHPSMSENTN